jgi:hypothetical protein
MEQYGWARDSLLPKVYWEPRANRADTIELRDAYRAAAQNASAAWQAHPLTLLLSEKEIQRFHSWAE